MRCADDRGYAMAALLVALSVMGIMLSVALPVWRTAATREREAELVFRGEQYAHAIELFSRRTGGFPPSLDVLEKGRYIRKLYKDPMTKEGDFQPVYLGQPLPGQPAVPAQPGRGGPGGVPSGAPAGRAGRPTGMGGRGATTANPFAGAGAQSPGAAGQAGTIGAGPIIGVVSRSTAESLRLYNGRGRYNEWAFVAVAATTQAGGGQNPNAGPGGRGAPGVPGRGGRGTEQGGPRRGGPAAGPRNPFNVPGGFQPPGGPPSGRQLPPGR